MSLTFPLTDIIDRMKVADCEFDLNFNQDSSISGDGGIWVKDLAPPLWLGNFSSFTVPHAESIQIQALYNAMGGSISTFLAWNSFLPYPQADPAGSILGASTVKIHTVDSGMVLMRMKGLPVGYVLTLGDFFCFDYSSKRAFHQVGETVTADGSGNTSLFTVMPPLRSGAAADQVITLKKPTAIMKMVPGSFKKTRANRMKSVVTFQAKQVL